MSLRPRKIIGLDIYSVSRILFFTTCFLLSAVCFLPSVVQAVEFSDLSRAYSKQFGDSSWFSNTTLLVITVGIIAGIVLTLVLLDRYHRSRNTKNGYYSRSQLFRELCQAHELTADQQAILMNIARELQLKNPAVLFIEPKHLELALTETVVRSPRESIRKIFNVLFGHNMVPSGSAKKEESTWFAWTKVTDNPEADLLRKEAKSGDDERDALDSFMNFPQTQQWDPSLWQNVERAVDHNTAPQTNLLEIASIPQETPQGTEQIVREKPGYKPRYPETEMQDSLVHQSPGGQVSSSRGDSPKAPPSPGAQILSSMLYSVSDVTNELAYSSIRNHLTRSLSLSPQSLGEMKPRVPEATPAVSLDEIMVMPQKPFRQQLETQTLVETKTEPKVAIKQVELKSIDLKPPKPFWDGE